MLRMGCATGVVLAAVMPWGCGGGDDAAGEADAAAAGDAGSSDAATPDAGAPDGMPSGAPAVAIGAPVPDIVNASGTATFAVEYTGAASVMLTAADVAVATAAGDAACASVVVRDGTSSSPSVDVAGCTGDGAVTVTIAPGTATSDGGVPDAGAGPGPSLAVDNTPPVVRIGAPSPVTAAAPGPFVYTIDYDGADAVSLTDAAVTVQQLTGTAACATRTIADGTTPAPSVTLADCSGWGTLRVRIAAGTASDRAGNQALAAPLGPSVALLQPSGTLAKLGHLGGLGQDVAVAGATACVAKGLKGVECWDVTDPAAPVLVHELDTAGEAHGIALDGDHAYVADDRWGLVIVDLAGPGGPELRALHGPASTFWGMPRRVVVRDGLAFVANGAHTQVIDVSDPAAPALVAELPTTGLARDVAVADGRVYVADGDGALAVWDLTDPGAPVSLPGFTTPMYARGIAVAGTTAYLGADYALWVLDVAVSPPALLGMYDDYPNSHTEVDLLGAHAYVMASFGLNVYDVSAPAAPVPTVERLVGGTAAVAGSYVYVSGAMQSLRVYDGAVPGAPALVFARRTLGNTLSVTVAGTTAYVSTEGNDVAVVDISTPGAPVIVAEATTPGRPRAVQRVGDLLFVADEFEGLAVVDVAVPTAPMLVSTYDLGSGGDAYGIAVTGDHALLAADLHGLAVMNVANPAAPALVTEVDTPGRARDVAVAAGYAYVADGASGVAIVDVSVPAAPVLALSLPVSGSVQGVAVTGDVLVAATLSAGVQLYDISTPTTPLLLGSYADVIGRQVAVAGTRAYVATGAEGIVVLDIADPTAPAPVDSAYHGGPSWDVAVAGGHALVADGENGLVIVEAE